MARDYRVISDEVNESIKYSVVEVEIHENIFKWQWKRIERIFHLDVFVSTQTSAMQIIQRCKGDIYNTSL